MPQVFVMPAKVSPAPTKPLSSKNHGDTKAPRSVPATINEPATICTCRCRLIGARALLSVIYPAAFQASIPPWSCHISERPAATSFCAAWFERLPLRQCRITFFPGSWGTRAGSNPDSGSTWVPGICSPACSAGSRTSMRIASPAAIQSCNVQASTVGRLCCVAGVVLSRVSLTIVPPFLSIDVSRLFDISMQ